MSKETSGCLKGIFAIIVLIHHLYQYSGMYINPIIDILVQSFGYLAVGIFFFISGYGIFVSSKKKDYLNNFWKRRFFPLYLFYVVLIVLYLWWKSILGIYVSKIEIIQSFFFGKTLVVGAWYLQSIFIFYIIYYFVFKYIRENRTRIVTMTLCIVGYCLICIKLKLPTTWYESTFCLAIGMLWAFQKDRLDSNLKIKCLRYFWIILILFVGTYIMHFKLGIVFKMFSSVLFSIWIILCTYLLQDSKIIQNTMTNYLGKYSLEIYVAQGFGLILKKSSKFNQINILSFIAIVILSTFIIAWFLHQIHKGIYKILKKEKNCEYFLR